MAQKVILDVDTGADDAVALLLAGHHPALELAAVTVTFGNAARETTLANTLSALEAGCLAEVPVYAGTEQPLLGRPYPRVAGQEQRLPFADAKTPARPERAVDFLIDIYRTQSGRETVYVPLGPLTNLALAISICPEIAQNIPQVMMMGGAIGAGNITPSAEFNILADPEAAAVVFNSGLPITMVGLEVTRQAEMLPEDVEPLEQAGKPWSLAAAGLIRSEIAWFQQHGRKGGEIFDACAVAALIDPSILTIQDLYIEIELGSGPTRGRTAADINRRLNKPANIHAGIGIDRRRFLEILYAGLG